MAISQINSNSLASGVPAKANLPAGSTLQVVQATKTDTQVISSETKTDITGMSVTITPSSSSSKILLFISVAYNTAGNANHGYVFLLRNGTEIFKGDASSGRVNSTLAISAAIGQSTDTGVAIYLDSPATTSAVTYKLQAWSGQWNEAGQPVYINRTQSDRTSTDYDQRVVSSITAMEISA